MSVFPVPTTRSSDLLGQTRLIAQIQSDQLAVLRYQSQISSGRRISKPSEDAPAALRAQTLQRLLELKAQSQVNLEVSLSYLDSSDSAISGVAKLLSDIRATALSVADTTSSDTARQAAAEEVRHAIDQLTSIGNHSFRGRYLFAGSRTPTPPFASDGKYVAYTGNYGDLTSYVDLDTPYATNIPGSEVFGAFSPQVTGTVDLDPVLTRETLLADLRGGQGVTPGSIAISDGVTSRTIDISAASTLGDVADLLAANPPVGRTITARVTASGLTLQLDAAGGGNLTVREVGGGTTAAELGIWQPLGVGISPIVGGDLDPQLRLTTRLNDFLGERAIAYLATAGENNDVIVESLETGTSPNGLSIQLVDDSLLQAAPGIGAGNEFATYSATPVSARAALRLAGFGNNLVLTAATPGTSLNDVRIEVVGAGAVGNSATASYNAGTKTLTLGVDSTGATQIQALINAIANDGTFTAAHDPSDPTDGPFNPFATIQAADAGVAGGNTGNSGGAARTVFVHVAAGASSANQVIEALNANVDFAAEFEARLDGADTSTALSAGRGVVDLDAQAITAGGSGAPLDRSGLRIVNGDETYIVPLTDAVTVEDLLNAINGSGANVLAEIDPAGDRIRIRSRLSGANFQIGENGGQTAAQLGVRSFTGDTLLADLNHGRGVSSESGADFTIRRRDGVMLDIDVTGAQDIGDVLDLINNHPLNLPSATSVVARLAATGNGIELIDANAAGVDSLQIQRNPLSNAAWDLGLIARGQEVATGVSSGTDQILTGADKNPLEVSGAFNALIRLHESLTDFNLLDVQRAIELLDEDFDRVNFARGEIGARGRALESMQNRLEDEEIELKSNLSNEIDTDLTEAIANLTARQAALEASLRLSAQTFQLSLLNFL